MKKGFTLAEIMIVLTVVGVLTAILLPSAINSTPDENVMKFKKANSTLGTAIRELVNSDEYYSDGDLATRRDGTLLDSTHEGDNTYFCESLADILSVKSTNCQDKEVSVTWQYWDLYDYTLEKNQEAADWGCKYIANQVGAEITLSDGIVIYQTYPQMPFGFKINEHRLFSHGGNDGGPINEKGFPVTYKTLCVDVDGIPSAVTKDDCVNECPFGYGIRADGKILPGKRALEWINKSVQNKE